MNRRRFLKLLGVGMAVAAVPFPNLFARKEPQDIWSQIVADPDFSTYFDPVSKHDIVMSGYVGSFSGVNIITDGFR